MSFMPNVGCRVRLQDGREGVIVSVDPMGKNDRIRFDDGNEEVTDAWKIGEILIDDKGEAKRSG